VAIARLRAHRLLGLRQKPGMAIRIGEGSPEDPLPSDRYILLIAARHLFRLIAEREDRLRRGTTRHTKPCPLCLQANRRIDDSGNQAYRGTVGIQARHGGEATRGCGESAPDVRDAPDLPASVTAGLAAVEE
jgi:hypothetical protein